MMPMFMQQLQNPAVQNLVSNPEALAAISQIQQGMQRLQTAAPDLYQSMAFPSVTGPGLPMGLPSSTPSTATINPSTPAEGNSSDPSSSNAFSQLMNQMVSSMASQGLNSPPEERFRTQLEQLSAMGFVDRQANIQGIPVLLVRIYYYLLTWPFSALIATYGDVNAAINRLLNSRQPGEQN